MPPTRDLACNPGMCPDWPSNQWPSSLQDDAQPTRLHQSGPQMHLEEFPLLKRAPTKFHVLGWTICIWIFVSKRRAKSNFFIFFNLIKENMSTNSQAATQNVYGKSSEARPELPWKSRWCCISVITEVLRSLLPSLKPLRPVPRGLKFNSNLWGSLTLW